MAGVISMLKRKKYIYRSSITGKIVSKLYALTHPSTTTKERVK